MKKIITMICIAAAICLTSCKDKAVDTQSVEKDAVALLQEDLDNNDAKQMIIDLGNAATELMDLSKTDADKGKELLEKVQTFLKTHETDINKLGRDEPKLAPMVEKIKKMDVDAVSKMKDHLK
jgi:phosphoribosylamine-glycine ligase